MSQAPPPACERILPLLKHVRPSGNGWSALCPAHDDHDNSLSVAPGEDGRALVKCHAGCTSEAVLDPLGMKMRDLFSGPGTSPLPSHIAATYDYLALDGSLAYQVVRRSPKGFHMRRPDGSGGWINNMTGVERLLYRFPELVAAEPHERVFVVEGEKDVDRLVLERLVATTNPGGVGKWLARFSEALRDCHVVIVPDADPPGQRHAEHVASSLVGVATSIRVVHLTPLASGAAVKDISDWLDGGGNVAQLTSLVDATPDWHPRAQDAGPMPDSVTAPLPRFPRTDAGNGELLAHLHGGHLRYDRGRHRWLRWAGHRWAPESDAALPLLAVQAARARFRASEAIGDLDERKRESRFAIDSENRKQVDAALYFARSLAPISDVGDTWDADPYLLGCPNAVVNLKTGLARPGRPEDRITMTTGVEFDPGAQAPRWNRFLAEVFEGDLELMEWVQLAAGYSATGDTREQVWFLKCGSGSNGKGVFDRAIANVLGDYATNTPFATLEAKTRPSIPNDLAALLGRRFVTASESSESSHLNEARLKALTGGDPIAARFLNHEFFTFKPALKLWLSVNHLPRVEDLSYGFWRRVRLVPFHHEFKDQAVDRNLDMSLCAEASGILAWLVRGAVAWERQGLEPIPHAVRIATTKYEADSDSLSEFIEERCAVGDTFTVAAGDLYRAYDLWATDRGLRTKDERLSATAFGKRMGRRFRKRPDRRFTIYYGIGLAADSPGARGE